MQKLHIPNQLPCSKKCQFRGLVSLMVWYVIEMLMVCLVILKCALESQEKRRKTLKSATEDLPEHPKENTWSSHRM